MSFFCLQSVIVTERFASCHWHPFCSISIQQLMTRLSQSRANAMTLQWTQLIIAVELGITAFTILMAPQFRLRITAKDLTSKPGSTGLESIIAEKWH